MNFYSQNQILNSAWECKMKTHIPDSLRSKNTDALSIELNWFYWTT